MPKSLNVEQLVELKKIFEKLVKTNKIKYINFTEDVISEDKRLKKSIEYYEMLITWFKIYDGQIIKTKRQFGYEDIMEAIKMPELIHLKHWITGQKVRLSNKRLQPHEYILLKLSGVEFKTNGKTNPLENAMLKHIIGSSLHNFVIEEDEQMQIVLPKRLILK